MSDWTKSILIFVSLCVIAGVSQATFLLWLLR